VEAGGEVVDGRVAVLLQQLEESQEAHDLTITTEIRGGDHG